MKSKFILIIALVLLISCKKENNTEKKVVNKFFFVELEASASKSDDFSVYYTEDGTINFNELNVAWRGIAGGHKFQKIQFNLDEEIVPTHIRMDFGMKQNQDSVVIKNIKVSYYDNAFEIKGSDFFKYFENSDQFSTTIDNEKGTLTIFKKGDTYKTPYYYPLQTTIESIKKITKEDGE